METNLTLKSISQLFKYRFFIPSYQRGYRWTPTQVTQLLEDIWKFAKEKDEKTKGEFYCLQPIVVKRRDDQDDQFEVIDGQQRLTTIFLILKNKEAIIEGAFPNFSFSVPDYETRSGGREFLGNVKTKTADEAEQYIDDFHIWKAYETIDNWFKNKEKNINAYKFMSALLDYQSEEQDGALIDAAKNVRVIWYEINETESANSIDIFTRLNIGKIPLTNAELIKALFLQKGNFTEDKAKLRQIQIASEWDIIEKTLQDDAFWFFIYNPENPLKYDNRIEYIFDLMQERTKDSEYYHTYNKFNQEFLDKRQDNKPDIDKIWMEIKRYFLTFEEWFKDHELFHYIGFLIECEKYHDSAKSKKNIIALIKENFSKKTKTLFKNYLREEIKKRMDFNIDLLDYQEDKANIRKVLLLFNIQTVLASKNTDMRFPFHKYKAESWDIEHICSQTDQAFDKKNRLAWIDDILDYFTGSDDLKKAQEFSFDNDEIRNICEALIEIKKIEIGKADKIDDGRQFEYAYKLTQKHFEEDKQTEHKDDISNLALLDASTNRSYKNSFFPIKRKRIIENDKNGIFIPIGTKNVFLKYYTKKMGKIMYWTSDDARDYVDAIKTALKDYLLNEEV